MPRLAKPLPVLNDDPPHIAGDGESLIVFMSPVNDPWIRATMGEERVIEETSELPGCRVTEAERFKNARGDAMQGRRYLWTTTGSDILGVLHITLQFAAGRRKPRANVSNIFVHPDHRRKGLATAMIRRVQKDFPGLMVDSSMSHQGAALFLGQDPTLTARASPRAEPSEAGTSSGPGNGVVTPASEAEVLLQVEPTPGAVPARKRSARSRRAVG